MKKFISALLIISILLITLSVTPIAADADTVNYAYLNDFQEREADFGSNSSTVVIVQMFDSNGNETIYNCAPTIKINNVTYSGTELILAALAKGTFASFVLNEAGEIISLDYTSDFPADRMVNVTLQDVLCETLTSSGNSIDIIKANMHFNYVLEECIVIMAIYDNNGTLLNSTWKPSPSFAADFDISLIADASYLGCPVKIFFWDAFSTISPLNTVLCGTVVRAESEPQYGYVNAIAADEVDFGSTGYDIKFQLITTDGVIVADLKSDAKLNVSDTYYEMVTTGDANTYGNSIVLDTTNWTDNDVSKGAYMPNAYTKFEILEKATVGHVVKYSKDNNGLISTITTAGYNKSAGSAADFSEASISGNVTYSAENPLFTANDSDSSGGNAYETCSVFVVGDNISECQTAVLSDLVIGNTYKVLASYTEKPTGSANVIVISYDTFIDLGLQNSLAVITEIGNTTNGGGEPVWTISYLMNSELIPSTTTPEVAAGTKPTIGDIVKIETGDDGLINEIVTVWDFTENIRVTDVNAFDGTENDYALPVANTELINTNDVLGEAYYGGYVTSYARASKIMVVDGKEFKISEAENVYVIDNTGRTLYIDNGSAGDFWYHSHNLYDPSINTVDIYDYMGRSVFENIERTIAQKYADHVYVRLYKDKPVDLFIVKGADLIIE